MITRREFLDTLAVGAAGLAIGSTARSYGQILGSNDRLNFAIIGLNGRAYAHLSALKANKDTARVSHVCDVDGVILKKFAGSVQDSGEGRWTVMAAIEENVSADVIAASLFTRFRSRQEDTFSGKVLAALRNEFGGHAVKEKE